MYEHSKYIYIDTVDEIDIKKNMFINSELETSALFKFRGVYKLFLNSNTFYHINMTDAEIMFPENIFTEC